jgi:glycerophosphoryl diester phosphodiesterase
LSHYDINYYLQRQPPDFLLAVIIAAALTIILGVFLIRLILKWAFAIPLLLFENVAPSQALRTSGRRTQGHRGSILLRMAAWLVLSFGLVSLISAPIGILGRWLLPLLSDSLTGALAGVGVLVLYLFISNFATSVIATIAFSFALFGLYRPWARVNTAHLSSPAIRKPGQWRILSQLKASHVVLVLTAYSLLAIIVGTIALKSLRSEDHTLVTAHRGASAVTPENTMAAVRQAIEDGADFVEIDVQETADGHVVVFHDRDFKRVADNGLKIWDATLSDLQQIDVGSHFSPEFEDERVPTLEKVLLACKGRIGVNIELKSYGRDQDLVQRVIDLVEKHSMEDEIILMSLKLEAVRETKALRPEWKVGLLTGVAIGNLARLDVDFLAVNVGLASRSFVRSAHRRGKEVFVWTVNDPITMSTLVNRGVENLITDRPAMARQVLTEREGLSSVERLLIEIAGTLGAAPEYELSIEDF